MTATGENQAPVQNTIGEAIVDAIVKADKEGRKFRVIVIIPSIPGFAEYDRRGTLSNIDKLRFSPDLNTNFSSR